MPRKDTKDAYIRTITSRINYMTRELARRDPKTAVMLSLQRVDLQSDDGLVKIGEYDPYLGGKYEILFKEEPLSFGHWPDPDNPIDMVAFWDSFLTSNYLLPLFGLLRLRLIARLYRLDAEDHDRDPDDPCGIIPSLKDLTLDQLARLASKLKRALPAPKTCRPKKMFWDANLSDLDLVRDVGECSSKGKSVRRACEDIASKDKQTREHDKGGVRKRYLRMAKLFRDACSDPRQLP